MLVLYENDKHSIQYKSAVALADELNIDLQWLLDSVQASGQHPCCPILSARKLRPGHFRQCGFI